MNLKQLAPLMGFFDKHKALIITILSMLFLLLLLFSISLHPSNNNFAGTIIDLELEELQQKEESPAEEDPTELPESNNSSPRTHQAFNQEQDAREQNFQQRLEEIFERNSAQQETIESDENSQQDGDYNINTGAEQPQERSDGDNTSNELSQQTGSIRNSSISFSLVGRVARIIPNPVYTCDANGKIVVNIKVNSKGEVYNSTINKASSTSTNQCLEEKALEYAAQARFSEESGRNSQIGTITYHFQG